MKFLPIVAILLIAAGVGGLVYGQFSYTKESHDVTLGPLELSIEERETVNIPVWAGVAAIAAGAGTLLFVAIKK